ncbi:MAG: S8 family serine peptidase [Candidatus Roizmanbacteria bacterium]|nr:S8 family serine peptidase [Candidatus Roizmanbacteria bacterium]
MFLLVFVYTFFSIGAQTYAEESPPTLESPFQEIQPIQDYVEGEVLVKYKSNKINLSTYSGRSKALKFIKAKSLEKAEDLRGINTSVLKITDDSTVEKKVAELEKDPNVEYAQPNFQYYPTDINTDDTDRDLLWGLDNVDDKDIDAPEAWDINEGTNSSVIVAVIDTGIAYNHPDLTANMWDGTNCKDENGNPLGGCNYGYDYEDDDKTPLPTNNSHGTHIAGTIGAVKNNGKGIIGVAPNVKIMAVKSALTTSSLVKGIDFAKQNNAKVINASWGGSSPDELMKEAIDSFPGLFVAAAGNHGTNNDSGAHFYPSDYDSVNIISVAATDQNDNLASFSDYGSTSVDVGAPGVSIYSTIPSSDIPVMSEDFDSVIAPNIPTGWVKTGDLGTVDLGGILGNALYGDINFPYANDADFTITSPIYDLSTGGNIDFWAQCDTQYITDGWADYMALEFSNDGGSSFTEVLRWDEAGLDFDSDPSGSAEYYFQDLSIPGEYLSTNFKFRFRWITDSSDNDYSGCLVDDIAITRFSDGSDEKYGYMNGTSMATPHVVGLAALIWGYRPDLTYTEVKNTILNTGDNIDFLSGKIVSGKRINAFNAINSLVPATLSSIAITTPASKLSYTVGDALDISGLVVTGTYSDDSTKIENITSENVTGFDSSVAVVGQVLTITVGEQTTTYTVNINAPLSSEKDITSFTFPEGGGEITETNIDVTMPFGTDTTALVPTIVISDNASVDPASGIAQDFTNPMSYAVTAEDSSTQVYTVTVTVSTDPDIDLVTTDKNALSDADIQGENPDLLNITLPLSNPLPSIGTINESTITWVSSDPTVVSNDGQTINRPLFADGDSSVTLTATFTKNLVTQTKAFQLVVLKLDAPVIVLSSIAITTPASKLSYTVGDALDISGLVVTGMYSDDTSKIEDVTAANITGFDSSIAVVGQVLTITVGEKTTTYIINIVAPVVAPVVTPVVGGGGGGGGGNAGSSKQKVIKGVKEDGVIELQSVELQSSSVAAPFGDINGHWAESFIDNLRLKGVINGKAEGKFEPDSQITRAELVKIVVNLYGIDVPASLSEKPFSDVEIGEWYAPYVSAAKTAGLIGGYSDGTFKPNQAVSRVEALKILLEASKKDLTAETVTFPDTSATAWYAKYINYAKTKGLVDGYKNGTFGPTKNITRGEFAKLASMISE